jgi:hypothetical protein
MELNFAFCCKIAPAPAISFSFGRCVHARLPKIPLSNVRPRAPDVLSAFLNWFLSDIFPNLHGVVAAGHAATYALYQAAQARQFGTHRPWFGRIRSAVDLAGPRSRAEMDALAELPNVRMERLPKGKLSIHEEFPASVASIIRPFLMARRASLY